jgi:hypothetical protein
MSGRVAQFILHITYDERDEPMYSYLAPRRSIPKGRDHQNPRLYKALNW